MIDTKALRSKVLDLAVQGKLTEQLESDGTAEELYQQIQEEKQKLIKEGKIKKEKALQPISNEEIPFEIPSNWKWVHMGEIFQHNTGKALNSSKTDGELLEYITTSNVYWDKFDFKVIKKMPFTESEIEKCTITKGDLLICEGGDIGRSAIWSFDYDMRIQNHLHRLRGYLPEISHKYYFYMMRMYKHSGLIDGRGIGLQGFSSTRVHNLVIPLPPFAEQQRIVERVEEIFKYLNIIDEAQKKYSADAEILKSKLITMGIQGKLTKQLDSDGTAEELYQQIQEEKQIILNNRKGRKDNSIIPIDSNVPFTIPKNWKWIRFGETGFFRKGPFGSSLTKAMFVPKNNDTIKVYEQQHAIQKNSTLGTYYITKEYFESKMSGFEVCAGDIIVSCAGTIGETYVMPENIEKGIINQALMRITLVPSIEKRFFLYYFDANLKQDAQSGNGSAITNIPPFDVLKNWCFPLPPLAEQKRIADTLDEVLRVIG